MQSSSTVAEKFSFNDLAQCSRSGFFDSSELLTFQLLTLILNRCPRNQNKFFQASLRAHVVVMCTTAWCVLFLPLWVTRLAWVHITEWWYATDQQSFYHILVISCVWNCVLYVLYGHDVCCRFPKLGYDYKLLILDHMLLYVKNKTHMLLYTVCMSPHQINNYTIFFFLMWHVRYMSALI